MSVFPGCGGYTSVQGLKEDTLSPWNAFVLEKRCRFTRCHVELRLVSSGMIFFGMFGQIHVQTHCCGEAVTDCHSAHIDGKIIIFINHCTFAINRQLA